MTCNAFFHFFHTLQGHCILADFTARMRQRQCEYVSSNMLRNTRAWHILVPRCCKDVASDKLKTVVHPMDKKGWLGSWKRVPEIGNQSCRWWICEPRVTALFLVVWSTQYFEKQVPCWKIGLWTVCGLACHLKRNFVREPRLGQSIQQHIVVLTMALGSGTSLRRSSTCALETSSVRSIFLHGFKTKPVTIYSFGSKSKMQIAAGELQ